MKGFITFFFYYNICKFRELKVILKSTKPIPVSKMREETGLSDYKIRKWLETLDEKK